MVMRFAKQIFLTPQAGLKRHDDGFAQGVDRWVGDLCKLLTEVVIQWAHVFGHDGEGCVVAHRTDRLLRAFGQYTQDLITFFKGDIEQLFIDGQLIVVHGRCGLREIPQT